MKRESRDRASGDVFREPLPLIADEGAASEALRGAMDAYRADLDADGAWKRLAPRVSVRPASQKLGLYLALGFAAGLAFVLAAKKPSGPNAEPTPAVAALPPSAPEVRSEPVVDEPVVVKPSQEPRALREGKTRLVDGSVVHVSRGGEASVRARAEESATIDLARGSVELEVAHQPTDRHLEVVSGVYHFVALGTQFRVSVASERVELEVTEGTVGVFDETKMVARVEPGHSWSGEVSPGTRSPRARSAGRATPGGADVAPGTDAPDCAAVGRTGNTNAALECYTKQSEHDGMSGELALYEIARLRKDVLSDYAGALDALKGYEKRFPKGSLRGEVQVSEVELLGRLGKNQEALSESARLLETPWGKERASDLHLLRGNLYRQGLRDYARAETEYALLANEHGPAGDEAQFQRAFCLERLGQSGAAARLYETYLQRPKARHAADARARLQALSP